MLSNVPGLARPWITMKSTFGAADPRRPHIWTILGKIRDSEQSGGSKQTFPVAHMNLAARQHCLFSHRSFQFFMFFLPRVTSSPFFCVCFVFRSSSLSVFGASAVIVGVNRRTYGHVITKFFRIYRLPHFLSRARELC